MDKFVSDVQASNIRTMRICSQHDRRQAIPDTILMPPLAVRILRAKLLVEELLETLQGLGITLSVPVDTLAYTDGQKVVKSIDHFRFVDEVGGFIYLDDNPAAVKQRDGKILDMIDGVCDLVYVAIGTLCSFGVPDLPHLLEVCRANDSKFPGGKATFNADGKYQKPPGWTPPDHFDVIMRHREGQRDFLTRCYEAEYQI